MLSFGSVEIHNSNIVHGCLRVANMEYPHKLPDLDTHHVLHE